MNPEQLALKVATQEMIRDVGGLEAAAGYCRVGKTVLGDNQSFNRPDSFAAIDVVADLQVLTRGREGWPHVTRALAARDGFALVELPEALPERGELLKLVAGLSKEGGEIANAICTALSDDDRIDAGEARTVRREIADLLRVAVTMDAAMAALEGGK